MVLMLRKTQLLYQIKQYKQAHKLPMQFPPNYKA